MIARLITGAEAKGSAVNLPKYPLFRWFGRATNPHCPHSSARMLIIHSSNPKVLKEVERALKALEKRLRSKQGRLG